MNAAEQNWNIFREKKLLKNKFLSAKTSKRNTVFEIPVLLKEPNNIRCKGKKSYCDFGRRCNIGRNLKKISIYVL